MQNKFDNPKTFFRTHSEGHEYFKIVIGELKKKGLGWNELGSIFGITKKELKELIAKQRSPWRR